MLWPFNMKLKHRVERFYYFRCNEAFPFEIRPIILASCDKTKKFNLT